MALNIKNEETSRLVNQLAQETGLTLTESITIAVKEKLERLHAQRATPEQVLALAKDSAARMPDWFKNVNPDDLLYGEDGLPL